MHISQFAKGMSEARSKLYTDHAEETLITDTTRNKVIISTLDYSRSVVESTVRFCEA